MYSKYIIDRICEHTHALFVPDKEPRSIILNFSDKDNPHGCRRKCSYCNWKTNPLAQETIYPEDNALGYYLVGHHGLITISGGGDPLYKYPEHNREVNKLINLLILHGRVVRVITREADYFDELQQMFPYVLGSFSIDSFDEIHDIDNPFLEYSIVLTPEIVKEVIVTKGACCKGVNMVFREPLQTGYKPALAELMTLKNIYPKSEFSTEKSCYESYYLVGSRIIQGYDIFGRPEQNKGDS